MFQIGSSSELISRSFCHFFLLILTWWHFLLINQCMIAWEVWFFSMLYMQHFFTGIICSQIHNSTKVEPMTSSKNWTLFKYIEESLCVMLILLIVIDRVEPWGFQTFWLNRKFSSTKGEPSIYQMSLVFTLEMPNNLISLFQNECYFIAKCFFGIILWS